MLGAMTRRLPVLRPKRYESGVANVTLALINRNAEIRRLHREEGRPYSVLARLFGLSESRVYDICRRNR